MMASQEAIFIIQGDNLGKMSYTRDKTCSRFFGSTYKEQLLKISRYI
jgi:hypothetical protein